MTKQIYIRATINQTIKDKIDEKCKNLDITETDYIKSLVIVDLSSNKALNKTGG